MSLNIQSLYSALRVRFFDDWPPVFHITQWKAGSQWIREILTRCIPHKKVMPSFNGNEIICRNTVYAAAYLSKQEYESLRPPVDSRYFIVLRDPRDILVSGYYSLKFSHVVLPGISKQRKELDSTTLEEGMFRVMDTLVAPCVDIAVSWVKSGAEWIRYEELLKKDVELLSKALLVDCRLPIKKKALEEAVLACRFEKFSGGRKPGQEDINSHLRKGIAGDWKNQFTPRVKAVFKQRFGEALRLCGYEKDNDW
jgi:lipopolysaccharide transport system ATP-binding protein